MGILDNLEKGIERAINAVFARAFRSGLQPVEIVAALKRELDSKASIITRDRILVPNRFTVQLSVTDKERLDSLGSELINEIRAELNKHIEAQGYRLVAPLSIAFTANGTLGEGMVQVQSESTDKNVLWVPYLIINQRRQRLQPGKNIIGRGSEADITINDSGASRNHLEIVWKGKTVTAKDLGSTNGTKLNGVKFNTATLNEDDVLQIGRTQLIFVQEPENKSVADQYRKESIS